MATCYTRTIQRNDFGRRGAEIDRGSVEVVRKTGLVVIVEAAPLTPVDTGLLVGSPEVRDTPNRHAIMVAWWPPYAAIQEARKRYAEQGAERAAPGFVQAMREVLDV
jgi:hypothetical protein